MKTEEAIRLLKLIRKEEAESGGVAGTEALALAITSLEREMEHSFPVLPDRIAKPGPLKISWRLAARAYSAYVQRYGSSQSLERLAERGGFYWSELDEYVPGWRETKIHECECSDCPNGQQ